MAVSGTLVGECGTAVGIQGDEVEGLVRAHSRRPPDVAGVDQSAGGRFWPFWPAKVRHATDRARLDPPPRLMPNTAGESRACRQAYSKGPANIAAGDGLRERRCASVQRFRRGCAGRRHRGELPHRGVAAAPLVVACRLL